MVHHLEISDTIEEMFNKQGLQSSFSIMSEFIDYLRSKFLSKDPIKMQRAIDLLDFLMKNASSFNDYSYIVYHLIGRKRVLKTLSRTARNLTRSGGVDPRMRVVGVTILGCIQIWGEAFSSGDRQELYSFYAAMKQLEEKYNVGMPFIPYDPSRVPIFLRKVTTEEFRLALIQAKAKVNEPESDLILTDDESMENALGLKDEGEVKQGDLLIFDSPPDSPRTHAPIPSSRGIVPDWMYDEPPHPTRLLSPREAADLFDPEVPGVAQQKVPGSQLQYGYSEHQYPLGEPSPKVLPNSSI